MNREFCFSNKLVQYILRKVECEPAYVFSEQELTSISPKDFTSLKNDKLIIWQQFDYEHDLFFSSIQGDQSNPRHLKQRKDGKYWANPTDDPELDRILVEEKDIPHYRFDVTKLISRIAKKNKLVEQTNSVSDRLWFVGSKDVSGDRVGIFLALNDSADDLAKELKGLPSSVSRYARYIVISPFSCIACQKTKSRLNGTNVGQFVFDEAFEDDLKFKSGFVFSEAKSDLPKALQLTGKIENEKYIVALDNKEGGLT